MKRNASEWKKKLKRLKEELKLKKMLESEENLCEKLKKKRKELSKLQLRPH